MTKVDLTQGVWNEVFTGVTSANFYLVNYPDKVQKCSYKITYGTSLPAIDTDAMIFYDMNDNNAIPVSVSNSTAVNIYVLPVYDTGRIVY